MSKFNKITILCAALCASVLSCDRVDDLSNETTLDSFAVTGVAPGNVTVESVDLILTPDNPNGNKIVINTDATNSDYPVSVLVDVKYSNAEKIFFIPAKDESIDWDFMSPLVFNYGESYKFVLIAESGLVNTYTISLTDNATGGGGYLEDLYQIPNSDFEQWINVGTNKININPTSIEGNNYWCTANNYFVQGTHPLDGTNGLCAQMVTKKVDFVYRTIAAGTTFTGTFSTNVNLENPRQMTFFGSKFIKRPKSISFRMSYKAGDQLQKVENGAFVNLPGKDTGEAWVQLLHYSGSGEMEYHKEPAPGITVLGGGQRTITDTNGWVDVTIDIDYTDTSTQPNYTDTSTQPNYIAIVFTSSTRGDYFEGAPGSTLLIDDVKLNY